MTACIVTHFMMSFPTVTSNGKIELYEGIEVIPYKSDENKGYRFKLKSKKKHIHKFKCQRENERDLWVAYIDGIANGYFEKSTKLLPEQTALVDAAIESWMRMIRSPTKRMSSVSSRHSSSLDEGIVSNFSGDDSSSRALNEGGPIKNHKFYIDTPGTPRHQPVPSWFFERCNRQLAETVLEKGHDFGNVLMRESVTFNANGSYVISLRRDTPGGPQYEHFEVIQVAAGYQINVENRHSPRRCLQDVMDYFMETAGQAYTRPFATNDLASIGIHWPHYQSVIQSVPPTQGTQQQQQQQQQRSGAGLSKTWTQKNLQTGQSSSKSRNVSQTLSAGSSNNPFQQRPCKDVAAAPMSLREVHRCRQAPNSVDEGLVSPPPVPSQSVRFTPSAPAEPPSPRPDQSQSQFDLELAAKLNRRLSADNSQGLMNWNERGQRAPDPQDSPQAKTVWNTNIMRPLPKIPAASGAPSSPTVPPPAPQVPSVPKGPPTPTHFAASQFSSPPQEHEQPPPPGPRPSSWASKTVSPAIPVAPPPPTVPIAPPPPTVPVAPPPPNVPVAPPPPAAPVAPPPPPVPMAPPPPPIPVAPPPPTVPVAPPLPAMAVTPPTSTQLQTQQRTKPTTKQPLSNSVVPNPPKPPTSLALKQPAQSQMPQQTRFGLPAPSQQPQLSKQPKTLPKTLPKPTRRGSESDLPLPPGHMRSASVPGHSEIVEEEHLPVRDIKAFFDKETSNQSVQSHTGKTQATTRRASDFASPQSPPETPDHPPPPLTQAPPASPAPQGQANTNEDQAMSTSEQREEFKRRLEVLMGGAQAGVTSPVSPHTPSTPSQPHPRLAQPATPVNQGHPMTPDLDENIYSEPAN